MKESPRVLEALHLRGIDRAEFTAEQWTIIYEFVTHNFGNLVGGATLALELCRDGQMPPDKIESADRQVKARYREIIDTLRGFKEGTIEREMIHHGDTENTEEVH